MQTAQTVQPPALLCRWLTVVLHLPDLADPQMICRQLAERGLPNLWVPAADSFARIDELPLLGSGKLDLRGLGELARERFGDS